MFRNTGSFLYAFLWSLLKGFLELLYANNAVEGSKNFDIEFNINETLIFYHYRTYRNYCFDFKDQQKIFNSCHFPFNLGLSVYQLMYAREQGNVGVGLEQVMCNLR
jgi:hypothetical protein